MSIMEFIGSGEQKQDMPMPGTMEHLEWLALLDAPPIKNTHQLEEFLNETNTTRTLALFTKRLRTFRPIHTPYIELDSRMINTEESWIPLFRSSIFRDPQRPDVCSLNIHSQPQAWTAHSDYSYDLSVPINFDFTYDPTRNAQAVYRYGKGLRASIFNQSAYPEYEEDNPNILVLALKEAAINMADIVRYVHGFDPVPQYVEGEVKLGHNRPSSKEWFAKAIADLLK